MTLSQLPLEVRDVLAVIESLRRLGFPSDDIFGVIVRDPRWAWKVAVLLKEGEREFVIDVGMAPSDDRGRQLLLTKLQIGAELWNTSPDEHLHRVYDGFMRRHASNWKYALVAKLLAKGFHIRADQN